MDLICGVSRRRSVRFPPFIMIGCLLTLFPLPVNPGHRNSEGRQLDAAKQPDGGETAAAASENRAAVEDMEDDGPWYLGKAREEYKRKRSQDASKPREDEDPVQVSF